MDSWSFLRYVLWTPPEGKNVQDDDEIPNPSKRMQDLNRLIMSLPGWDIGFEGATRLFKARNPGGGTGIVIEGGTPEEVISRVKIFERCIFVAQSILGSFATVLVSDEIWPKTKLAIMKLRIVPPLQLPGAQAAEVPLPLAEEFVAVNESTADDQDQGNGTDTPASESPYSVPQCNAEASAEKQPKKPDYYDGTACIYCGGMTLRRAGTCLVCDTCGSSSSCD